jgi:hypothetical protein
MVRPSAMTHCDVVSVPMITLKSGVGCSTNRDKLIAWAKEVRGCFSRAT